MKRFSLKLKLTAMYSFFMVLVTCLCLAVLFSLSGNEKKKVVVDFVIMRVDICIDALKRTCAGKCR